MHLKVRQSTSRRGGMSTIAIAAAVVIEDDERGAWSIRSRWRRIIASAVGATTSNAILIVNHNE
jgi:hypothetical protein